jgi:hypothetical protein
MNYLVIVCYSTFLGFCSNYPVLARNVSLSECERIIQQATQHQKPAYAYCRPDNEKEKDK